MVVDHSASIYTYIWASIYIYIPRYREERETEIEKMKNSEKENTFYYILIIKHSPRVIFSSPSRAVLTAPHCIDNGAVTVRYYYYKSYILFIYIYACAGICVRV